MERFIPQLCSKKQGLNSSTTSGCKAILQTSTTIFVDRKKLPSRNPSAVLVLYKAGQNGGCVFQNCNKAREWKDNTFIDGKYIDCWVDKRKRTRIGVEHPDPGARSRGIAFTTIAVISSLLIVWMIIHMIGLVLNRSR